MLRSLTKSCLQLLVELGKGKDKKPIQYSFSSELREEIYHRHRQCQNLREKAEEKCRERKEREEAEERQRQEKERMRREQERKKRQEARKAKRAHREPGREYEEYEEWLRNNGGRRVSMRNARNIEIPL